MWQKCWNTNTAAAAANMLQQAGVRYRERGPMKSWRPETMAEAIWSVLQEGLSLSQAARKHDIPYPTFVLYANRVHNMLGPSRNGGSPALGELRPKGRGRPQRILLGNWPESHVRQVIRAVVFREGGLSNISEDSFLLPPRSGEEELHSGASSSGIRPPSTHSERGEYSPPRKVTHTPPPTTPSSTSTSETLHNQLKSLYGQHSSSPKSLMAAVAAMGGPLSELIMKEIDFDPLMLKTLMRLQGNGVYDDADEAGSKRGDDGGKPSSSKSLPSLTLNPEVILTEISEGSKEAYDNLRPPRDLIAAGSTDS
uniref:HTH psq-type domain-containing protein n=1 Tax=Lepeophtheirus salmonis TaxID=72036 RepID=A0A0K2UBC1_LEPSM